MVNKSPRSHVTSPLAARGARSFVPLPAVHRRRTAAPRFFGWAQGKVLGNGWWFLYPPGGWWFHRNCEFSHGKHGDFPIKHTKNDGKSPFIVDFPLKMVIFHSYVSLPEGNITMENHRVSWENSLFLWPFSIAMLNYQRVLGHPWKVFRNIEQSLEHETCWNILEKSLEHLRTSWKLSFC